MSNHTGAVTVVRFSPDGKYLASGSDDRVILIWELDESRIPQREFGADSNGPTDTESWVARKRLTGHENDVQDLAWAPDSSILVTVGLDSSILIWSGTTFEKLKRIDIHQSQVKGVTFDPANKYFATASDDRTMRIVRYHRESPNELTFSVEATVSKPFEGSPISTYFRRCSWSPDGNHIAASDAVNGPVPTVAIVSRGTWESDISLVGHEYPCEVALFNPRCFYSNPATSTNGNASADTISNGSAANSNGNAKFHSLVATSGQDKILAIWNTSDSRPMVVANNIALKPITDLAWSPDGTRLFASSLDGSVIVAMFEEGELGVAIPTENVAAQLLRFGGQKDAMQVPGSVDQISLEEKISHADKQASEKKMDALMGIPSPATSTTVTSSSAAAASITTTAGETTAGQEQQEQHSPSPAPSTAPEPSPSVAVVEQQPPVSPKKPKILKPQKVTITKDGKKRVTPQLVSSFSQGSNLPQTVAQQASVVRDTTSNAQPVEFSRASRALPPGGVSSLVIGMKRKAGEIAAPELSSTSSSSASKKKDDKDAVPEFIRPAVASPAATVAQVRLAVPKVQTYFTKSYDSSGNSPVLEVRNSTGNEQEPTKVVLSQKGSPLFIDFLPRYGHLCAGGPDSFWAVSTEDGAIYVYSPLGRRIMPCITLGCSLSFLESRGQYLLAITSVGIVYVWDISSQQVTVANVSLAPVLDTGSKYQENGLVQAAAITQADVSDKGCVFLTLNNGQGYTFNTGMQVWQRVSESWWAFGSQYWNSTELVSLPRLDSGNDVPLVGLLERRTNQEVILKSGSRARHMQRLVQNRMLQEGFQGFESVVSISHLENRMASAIVLKSASEFRRFLVMYARRIAEEAMKDRLDELCRDLLGPVIQPVGSDAQPNSWVPDILGIPKHDLLKDVVLAAGRFRDVQDIIIRYERLIGGSHE